MLPHFPMLEQLPESQVLAKHPTDNQSRIKATQNYEKNSRREAIHPSHLLTNCQSHENIPINGCIQRNPAVCR